MSRNFLGTTAPASATPAPAPAAGVSHPNTGAASPRPAAPQVNPGLKQIDGNQSSLGLKPTKGSLQDRSASPASSSRTGMESSMGALADQLHPPKFRGRR